jgi:hypothetical protein
LDFRLLGGMFNLFIFEEEEEAIRGKGKRFLGS